MSPDTDHWLAALFHGWVELVTLFAMLLVALAVVGWCWNRGFRPADRGPMIGWPVLVIGYGLLLLLRHFKEGIWPALIIGVAVIVAGGLARSGRPRALWVPSMLIAALLGLGHNLGALLLTLATALVLLFSVRQGR
jgi:hypothetical protein